MELNFEKNIYGLKIIGFYDTNGRFFLVNAYFENKHVIDNQILNKTNDSYPFGFPGKNNEYAVHGLLVYCDDIKLEYPQLKLNLSAPVFLENITVFPNKQPYDPPYPKPIDPPVPQPLPADPGKNVTITDIYYQDLFPYLYIRPWPMVAANDEKLDFIPYSDTGAEEQYQAFYNQLVTLKNNNDRPGMENEAINFINGSSPYSTQFVRNTSDLTSIIKSYLPIYKELQGKRITFNTLTLAVQHYIGSWEKVNQGMTSQEYKNENEAVWESFFALNITLGYDFRLLDELIETLVIANLLAIVAPLVPDNMPKLEAALNEDSPVKDPNAKEIEIIPGVLAKAQYMKTVSVKEIKGIPGKEKNDESPDRDVKPEDIPGATQKSIAEIKNEEKQNKNNPDDKKAGIAAAQGAVALPPIPFTESDLTRMFHGTTLLPDQAFPLPPQYGQSPSPVSPPYLDGNEWLTPYAAGELQMVRYHLKSYQLGEISHIENILKGEIKEVTNRKIRRVNSGSTEESKEINEGENSGEETTADLINEINKTLFQKASATNYTAASGGNANGIGGWTIVENPAGGHNNNIARFAKDIVSRTVERINRKVSQERTRYTMEENEDSVVHRFDNSNPVQGQKNLLGIYRWVNKVYSLKTFYWGNRLIMEMMVDNPAENLLRDEKQYRKPLMPQPTPPGAPGTRGVFTYTDIVWDNPDSPLYYLKLMEDYGINDILPPPKKNLAVSTVVDGIKPFSTAVAEIPGGYESIEVYVTVSANVVDGTTANITVGKIQKTFPVSAFALSSPPVGDPIPLPGETGRIPVSVLFKKPSKSDGNDSGDEEETSSTSVTTDYSTLTASGGYENNKAVPLDVLTADAYYVTSFAINCQPTVEYINEWQYKTYLKIMQGYQQKLDEYYAEVNQGTGQVQSVGNITNDLEWQQVKSKCIRLLRRHYRDLVVGKELPTEMGYAGGDFKVPTQSMINGPRYLEFFENSLEWNQMTYGLLPGYGDAENYNIDLTSREFQDFLRAKRARILLPVVPERTYSFLYFLVTGMIWTGADRLAPAMSVNMAIFDHIKALDRGSVPLGSQGKKMGVLPPEPWEIIVPTSMVVLQESTDLPKFAGNVKDIPEPRPVG